MSKNRSNKENKGGFIEFLSVKAALPSDALTGDFRLEIRGRNTLIMYGCRRILKYTPEEIVISAKGFAVSIGGQRLICSTFHNGVISIEGYISSTRFISEDKGDV